MTLPAGLYAKTYVQDQAIIRTRSQLCWFLAFMIFLFVLPFFGGGRAIGIMNLIGIMVITSVGLQINTGYAGQVNLGQSAFMGVGAYSTAGLAVHFHLPFWLCIPLGGVAAAIFGSIFGLAAVRIKGFYMALTSIAAQVMFVFIMLKLPVSWFGQSSGLGLQPAAFGGFLFNTDFRIYYLILITDLIIIYGAWSLSRSRTGRAFVAIRDNENAAELIGINVVYYKALAFFIGAFCAGVAGGLWAYYVRYVLADQFTLWLSIWFVGMLIVGGLGSILGALVGTVVIRLLQEFVTYLGPQLAVILPHIGRDIVFAAMNVLLGGVITLFVIFEPKGLVYRWNIIKESYRIWPFSH